MHNTGEIMQLCRLCLVKEQVNVPIFEGQGDVRQIFQKISSCLPVKINRSDKLPKNICDGCSEKLDLFYDFWNTSVNSEKQLLEWLGQTPLSAGAGTTIAAKNSTTKPTDPVQQIKVDVKQEPSDHTDNNESFQAETAMADDDETSFKEESAPPPKRARRAVTKRKPITVAPDSDDDDDDDYEPVEPLTKLEDESGNSDNDNDNDNEDDSFAAPSTSADDQPGPSGLGKDGVEAPSEIGQETGGDDSKYQCGVCNEIFPSKNKFLEHHMNLFGEQYICCKCKMSFKSCTSLYNHYEIHKVGLNDEGSEIVEEIVLDYDEESNQVVVQQATDSSELLYILDDGEEESQVNEIIVEEPEAKAKADAVAIVNLEHGYMMPQNKRLQHALYGSGNQFVIRKRLSLPEKETKRMYTPPKVRTPQLKRRHEVPDFSATAYVYIQPSEEIEVGHYKCLRCEQLFINKFGFYRHIEKGKCYINNCDVCPATFSKNSQFYEHYVASHTDRAVCNFCFRTFMYEKNVKEHMLRHLDQFRHKCEDCNKGFYTVREYRNHYKNRHMGIRHKCNICGRSFADEYYFKRHVATHSSVTPTVVQLAT